METKNDEEKSNSQLLRLGIPSKGRMASETQDFLNSCGFKIRSTIYGNKIMVMSFA